MANRNLFQFQYSYQRDLVHIFAQVSFAAAGAPTLVSGKGVESIVRNSAGLYTINLQDSFAGVMDIEHKPLLAVGAPAAPLMVIRSVSNINDLSAPSVQVGFTDSSGVATDPASGEQVLMHIILKNTTA